MTSPALGPRAHLPPSVVVREVGPRDGLQSERPVAATDRARLAHLLVRAGCTRIEAASFVSAAAVPAMADGATVLAELRRLVEDDSDLAGLPLTVTALVPNLRGAMGALEAGADELTVTVAASAEYNARNVRRTIDESVKEVARICDRAAEAAVPVDAVISCAFGSPYEGEIAPSEVASLAGTLLDSGASTLTLADTTGMATPRGVEEVLEALETLGPRLPTGRPGLHLHETRGTSLVNAYAAMSLGVDRFDSSIGGLGGSPFATGAGGNLATEDFVALLDDLGVASGIDLGRLLDAARLAAELAGRELPSKVSHAGPRLG